MPISAAFLRMALVAIGVDVASVTTANKSDASAASPTAEAPLPPSSSPAAAGNSDCMMIGATVSLRCSRSRSCFPVDMSLLPTAAVAEGEWEAGVSSPVPTATAPDAFLLTSPRPLGVASASRGDDSTAPPRAHAVCGGDGDGAPRRDSDSASASASSDPQIVGAAAVGWRANVGLSSGEQADAAETGRPDEGELLLVSVALLLASSSPSATPKASSSAQSSASSSSSSAPPKDEAEGSRRPRRFAVAAEKSPLLPLGTKAAAAVAGVGCSGEAVALGSLPLLWRAEEGGTATLNVPVTPPPPAEGTLRPSPRAAGKSGVPSQCSPPTLLSSSKSAALLWLVAVVTVPKCDELVRTATIPPPLTVLAKPKPPEAVVVAIPTPTPSGPSPEILFADADDDSMSCAVAPPPPFPAAASASQPTAPPLARSVAFESPNGVNSTCKCAEVALSSTEADMAKGPPPADEEVLMCVGRPSRCCCCCCCCVCWRVVVGPAAAPPDEDEHAAAPADGIDAVVEPAMEVKPPLGAKEALSTAAKALLLGPSAIVFGLSLELLSWGGLLPLGRGVPRGCGPVRGPPVGVWSR